jgi:hypothetical protein
MSTLHLRKQQNLLEACLIREQAFVIAKKFWRLAVVALQLNHLKRLEAESRVLTPYYVMAV